MNDGIIEDSLVECVLSTYMPMATYPGRNLEYERVL